MQKFIEVKKNFEMMMIIAEVFFEPDLDPFGTFVLEVHQNLEIIETRFLNFINEFININKIYIWLCRFSNTNVLQSKIIILISYLKCFGKYLVVLFLF